MSRPGYGSLQAAGVFVAAVALVLAAVGDAAPALGGQAGTPRRRAVTFTQDVAPILFVHCAPCHRPGQVAPFSLLDYQDARKWAESIVDATKRRYMPPWKPEPGAGDFADVRRLGDDQIALIERWVTDGRQEGARRHLPAVPRWKSGWRAGEPDLVVSLPEPYLLEGHAHDVFRTFVVPVGVDRIRYVRALDFDPGSTAGVHHANVKIDTTRSSRWLDEQDSAPGYDGAGAHGAKFPDGHFLGWTPGQSPRLAPEALAWRLEPGSDMVIELHMMPGERPEHIRPRVGLYFTDQPAAQRPFMIRLGRQDIDIPAGEAAYATSDSYQLPVDVDVLAVQPHAHWLAREIVGTATRPGDGVDWLIHIKDWDMRWQDVYRFRRPVALPKGTVLTMRYTYDNSAANLRNPHKPPTRVTFGQNSSSEMGDLWIQVMPRTEADRQLLESDFAPKMLREDIAGIEKMLESDAGDPRLHADLAFCYLDAGRNAEAVRHLEEAVRLDPMSAGSQYDLGAVLLKERRFAAARGYLREAVRLKPDFSEALNDLGVISHAEGNVVEALQWYARALKAKPENAAAAYNLGRAYVSRGDAESAVEHYRLALRIKPDDALTHVALASVLSSRDVVTAVAHYRRALVVSPNLVAALTDLAWILATSELDGLRATAEAVRLAERASELTDQRNPTVLDTLAAAYAADGQFQKAVLAAERALAHAPASDAPVLNEHIQKRLDVYRKALEK